VGFTALKEVGPRHRSKKSSQDKAGPGGETRGYAVAHVLFWREPLIELESKLRECILSKAKVRSRHHVRNESQFHDLISNPIKLTAKCVPIYGNCM
jgi:hypothetical protein